MFGVFHNFDNKLYIEDIPIPPRHENEVLIKISYCCLGDSEIKLISGNDNSGIDSYSDDRLENNNLYGIGYEASGIIIETCDKAAAIGLKTGTPVCIHPKHFCGRCRYCKSGRENLCVNSTHNTKMMREYIAVDYTSVFPLEHQSDLLLGALTYPIACAMHAVELANIGIGKTVAVMGNSFITLIVAMLAHSSGAKKVSILGLNSEFCNLALLHGADHTFSLKNPDDLIRALNITKDLGYDIVLDASQSFSSEEIAMNLLGRGGTVVFFSQANVNAYASFNFYELFWKQATMKAAYACAYSFSQAILSIENLNLDFLYDNVYSLDSVQQALDDATVGRCIKPIIRFP